MNTKVIPTNGTAVSAADYVKSASEKELMQMLIDTARLNNWLCFHTHDSRRSQPGFPDIIAVRRGVILAFECKAQRGRVTPEQEMWLTAWAQSGAIATVVRPEPRDGELSYDQALDLITNTGGNDR